MTQSKADIAADMKRAMSVGDFDRAAMIGAGIIRKYPKRTDIQIMTAVSEMQGKNPSSAGPRLRRLFRNLSPDDKLFGPVAQNMLQYAYITNDFNSVESVIESRFRAAPQSDIFAFLLGDIIFKHEIHKSPGRSYAPRLEYAAEVLAKIPARSPRYVDAQKILARIHLHQEQHKQAFDVLERLTADNRNDMAMRLLLASSYAVAGEVEKAVSCSLSIIADAPDYAAQPYVIISFMRPQSMPDTAETFLTRIVENPKSSAREVYKAAFALARLSESAGDMKKAFAFYQKGHAANRAARPIDMAAEQEDMRRLGELTRQANSDLSSMISADIGADENGPRPIFIVGMPRSGTTLTERILGAHPDVHAAGEIGDFARAVAEVVGTGTLSAQLARIDRGAATEIRKRYLAAMKAYAPDKQFVANKTPANFLRVEMIRRVFPDAPIIHTHRHPLATCLSIYTTPFAIPMRFADDLGDLATYYRAYRDLMKVFFETDRNGMLFDLSYENLVADPEAVTKEYLAHCGLEWHPECLEFYRDDKAAATASMIQVRRPIFRDSLEKWQRFAPYIGPLAELVPKEKLPTASNDGKSSGQNGCRVTESTLRGRREA